MSSFHLKFAWSCPAWLKTWIPEAWAEWLPVSLFVLAAAACFWFVHRLYARLASHVDPRALWMFLILRSLAVTILLLFLFRPELTYLEGEKPFLLMLLDVSRSMSVRDHPDIPTRLEQVKSVVLHPPSRLEKAMQGFETRLFAFDVRSKEVPGPEVPLLMPVGEGTFISESLRDCVLGLESGRIAAVLLFSDGADNSGASLEEELGHFGFTVHTVGVGTVLDKKADFRDVRLADLEAPRTVTANQLAQVHAYVEATGFRDQVVAVTLTRDGKELTQEKLVLDDLPGPQKATLNYAPTETGWFEYRVEVSALPAEQIDENNHRTFRWEVKDAPIRILYVEGKPRPEFKFLKRTLEQHEATEIVTLVKVGPHQFLQQGQVEGVKDLLGFPQDRETLEKFDVIILGSIERANFSLAQMETLRAAVSNGAGFLMLGGYESFGSGGYGGSPVEEMLPVQLGEGDAGQEKEPFVPVLTREGKEHPIFFGIADFFPEGEKAAAKVLPPLFGCNRTVGVKPGATRLAAHPLARSEQGPCPVVAVQTFGQGRAMAFTADSTWQWYLQLRGLGRESPYVKFWVQACQWLAGKKVEEGGAEAGIKAYLEEEFIEPGRAAILRARAHDAQGLMTPLAHVLATIESPAQEVFQVRLPFLPDSRGLYEATFSPRVPGDYRIEVRAEIEGQPLGLAVPLKLRVDRPHHELEDLSLKEELLRQIATETGGRYVPLTQLSALADSLESTERLRRSYRHYALWNTPWLFALFVGLQTVEWILRKRKHLA